MECCSNYPQPTVWIVEKHSTPSNRLSYSYLQRFCGMWNVFQEKDNVGGGTNARNYIADGAKRAVGTQEG